MLGKINTNSASAAFERMEERVMMAEAKASATAELGMDNLEAQFAVLESGSDVDDELAALKAKMIAASAPAPALSPADANKPSVGTLIDSELESLRKQIDRG
jgi:phage shock protein A